MHRVLNFFLGSRDNFHEISKWVMICQLIWMGHPLELKLSWLSVSCPFHCYFDFGPLGSSKLILLERVMYFTPWVYTEAGLPVGYKMTQTWGVQLSYLGILFQSPEHQGYNAGRCFAQWGYRCPILCWVPSSYFSLTALIIQKFFKWKKIFIIILSKKKGHNKHILLI